MGAFRRAIAVPLLILVLVQVGSAARNLSITSTDLPGVIGVWDPITYPASRFRDDSVLGYFEVWPENLPDVRFYCYCEDPTVVANDMNSSRLSLSNFTYSTTQGRLDPRPYFDLGVIELYQPYWKHWLFWRVDTRMLTYPINCEYNDLHDLYAYRFWRITVKNGVAAAAVMQGIIQVIVAVVVTLRWGYYITFRADNNRRKNLMKAWFLNFHWGDWFSEVIHLVLLVLVGYSMMEAIGHSDIHKWRATSMYNAGVIFSYLSLFAVLSSISRQIAYAWMDPEKIGRWERERKPACTQEKIWNSLQDISDDWRWQRVFGQLGVLVLMGTYLSFVEDIEGSGMDQIAGLVLAATVVACIWSFGVTAVVLFRSIMHILAQVFPAFAKLAQGRVSPGLESPAPAEWQAREMHCMQCRERNGSRAEV